MNKIIFILLLSNTIALCAMEKPYIAPSKIQDLPEIKKVVIDYLNRNTTPFYKVGSPYCRPEVDLSKSHEEEVNKGLFCFYEDKAVVCAHGSAHFVDLFKKKIVRVVPIGKKLEESDRTNPAFTSAGCGKIAGSDKVQIFLGEQSGRVSAFSLKSEFELDSPREIEASQEIPKTFGTVPGKVLSFHFAPDGKQVAVKYLANVPCIAVSAAFLKLLSSSQKSGSYLGVESKKNNRRSWMPSATNYDWSAFATRECEHEVEAIRFENEFCITKCGFSKNEEKWKLINPETNPELVKIEEK